MLVSVDLKQIEWRVAAFLSQDPVMLKEIRTGVDQHSAACVDLMELPLTDENRTDAKIFNFRMIYYGTAYAFFMDNKMPNFSQKKWERVVNNFYEKYKVWHKWVKGNYKIVCREGTLQLPTGRILNFQRHKEKGGVKQYSINDVANYPVQGLSADIMQLDMVIINDAIRRSRLEGTKFINQVHDDIIFDCPINEVDECINIVYNNIIDTHKHLKNYYGIDFNVPIDGEVKVGNSWGKMEKYKL